MSSFIGACWHWFKSRWDNMTFFQRFMFLNFLYPWWPTLIYLATLIEVPADVQVRLAENAVLFGRVAGSAWEYFSLAF